jgi:hypothetical protein
VRALAWFARWAGVAALGGCAGAAPERAQIGAEERRRRCLMRMDQSRQRGAVNRHLYDACMAGRA